MKGGKNGEKETKSGGKENEGKKLKEWDMERTIWGKEGM
jgi:hypothetical protein